MTRAADQMGSDSPRWTSGGETHQGRVREINQDAFLNRPELGLWAVADGMGGHSDGAHASRSIIEALAALPRPKLLGRAALTVKEALGVVNRRLLDDAARLNSDLIGSTVVAVVAVGGHYAVLWTGDSRAYRLRHGELIKLTTDHSAVQALVDSGQVQPEQGALHPSANVLVHAVGSEDRLRVDLRVDRLHAGDRLLLCSDGLYRELSEREIGDLLLEHDPSTCPGELVRRACEHGGRDNVTAVVVGV